jgi:hypothetical protein
MLNNKILRWLWLGVAMVLGTFAAVVYANVPKGWFLAGSRPGEFESGVDSEQTYQAHASAFLKSKQTNVDGFGTLMQRVTAEQYKSKRIRLSGLVKSQDVAGWAGLWMRVDQGKDAVAFDNMQDRSIKGTTGWQRYDVILDVPKDATGVSFGILLAGSGEVWLSNTNFDVVGDEVAVTGLGDSKEAPKAPVNLDFTE